MATAAAPISAVSAFGEAAESLTQWCVVQGGFLVPGEESATYQTPGEEKSHHERAEEGARKEAGPAARSRPGRRASRTQATANPAPHPLRSLSRSWSGSGASLAEFDELTTYYPDLRVSASSSNTVFLGATIGIFRELSYRARLVLEVPHPARATTAAPLVTLVERPVESAPGSLRWVGGSFRLVRPPSIVPPVRTWARWVGGALHGMPIVSHHRYPDQSMCVCMSHQWIRGADPLVDLVGFAVSWVAKVIHKSELGFYPGLQHVREWVRVERDATDEYCGCGEPQRYVDCHRAKDRRLSNAELRELEAATREQYFRELSFQHRPLLVPAGAWHN